MLNQLLQSTLKQKLIQQVNPHPFNKLINTIVRLLVPLYYQIIYYQIIMEDDIKAKQDYLYKEIIEQNYDPEQFQEYIQTIKGLSLELYTLTELISIVEAFKKGEKYGKQAQEEPQVAESDPSFLQHSELSKQIQSKIQEDSLKNSQLRMQGNASHLYESSNSSNNVYHEFLLKERVSNIYTKIYQKKEKIRVKIRSYSKVQEESFFGSTYVSYLIETPEMGWTVRRRFNDFEWLQAKIIQIFPGYPVPPIPKKTAMRSFNDQHLQQRMNTFERYLNKLLNIPEICSELVFEQFLSVTNQQQFNKCKERFDLTLRNRGNKLITLKGQNLIDKSEFKLELTEFQFYKRSKQLLKHLNTEIGNLQTLLKHTTNKAFEVSSIFNEFHQHLSSKDIKAYNVMEVIGDFVSQLGYKLQKEHSFLRKQVQDYWNYQEKYLENIVSYMSKINKEHYQMLNKYKSMSNFEVDSDQEAKNKTNQNKIFLDYQQARQIYRVKLSFLRSEIVRHEQNDFAFVAKQWVSGLQNYMAGVRDLMISGVDQLTKAQCVAEGKKLVEVEYIAKKGSGGQGKKF